MSFWTSLINIFRRNSSTPRESGRASGSPRTGGRPLYIYSDSGALSVAAVFRCVKLLSESVATLPVQYLKYRGGMYVEARDPRLYYLLNVQPDVAMSAFDFRRQIVQELLLAGNAYIVPVYNLATMQLDRLALCGRGTVTHDTQNDLYTVTDTENGISGTYSEDEIIHIKGFTGRDHKHGISVLSYARLSMEIASTGDQETRNRFANGGNVRGIVSNDRGVRGYGEYQDEELGKTAESIDDKFRSGERIVSLPGQVEFQQISLSSTDMQFLESRKFTVLEICRFFGVPPTFVYADTSNNYKSVEQADADFLCRALNPLLRNIEIEFQRKLIAPELAGKYRLAFDRRELFSGNLSGMMTFATQLLQTGATVNEVRRLNNLQPVEAGDTVLVSANLRSIDEIKAQGAAAPEAPADKGKDDNEDKDDNENEKE